jgi:uncharacterized protein CbrC (UPF0167 family)
MGQYFKAVNEDKEEVVCPWCLGGGAKLWEWAANPYGSVFTLLLRRSSAGGGGDYYGYRTQEIHPDPAGGEPPETAIAAAMRRTGALEGAPVTGPAHAVVGRWAGDRVMLVGDYDSSGIWDRLHEYQNITEELVAAWNEFIEIDDLKLKFNPACSCREHC